MLFLTVFAQIIVLTFFMYYFNRKCIADNNAKTLIQLGGLMVIYFFYGLFFYVQLFYLFLLILFINSDKYGIETSKFDSLNKMIEPYNNHINNVGVKINFLTNYLFSFYDYILLFFIPKALSPNEMKSMLSEISTSIHDTTNYLNQMCKIEVVIEEAEKQIERLNNDTLTYLNNDETIINENITDENIKIEQPENVDTQPTELLKLNTFEESENQMNDIIQKLLQNINFTKDDNIMDMLDNMKNIITKTSESSELYENSDDNELNNYILQDKIGEVE